MVIITLASIPAHKQLGESAASIRLTQAPESPVASNAARALKWRRLVQFKVACEISGALVLMLSRRSRWAPLGSAAILAGHALFWLGGAASTRVDARGEAAPMPAFLVDAIFKADVALAAAATFAALLPVNGRARAAAAALYSTGVLAVVIEHFSGQIKRARAASDGLVQSKPAQ